MTLDTLNEVLKQLQAQYQSLVAATPPPTENVRRHCNQIEVLAAIQIMTQLIQQEQIQLAAPPGSTGPKI